MEAESKISLEKALQSLVVSNADVGGEPGVKSVGKRQGGEQPDKSNARTRYKSGYLVAFATSIALWVGIVACVLGLLTKVLR